VVKASFEFQVFAKPAGAICNLDCHYCYYLQKESLYPETESFRMPYDLLEDYIIQQIEIAPEPEINFFWHGGEPTILGLDYFRKIVELQRKHQPQGVHITNSIQTNGMLINEEWCRFFAAEGFFAAEVFFAAGASGFCFNSRTFSRIFCRALRMRFSRDLSPVRNDMRTPHCDATAFPRKTRGTEAEHGAGIERKAPLSARPLARRSANATIRQQPLKKRLRLATVCAELQPGRTPSVVALTGFMGAGKTSVGHALAGLLGWSFVDLDHEIELRQKQRVREIFQAQGEARFREIEAETLRAVLAQVSTATVIALGGGTFVQPENAALLRARSAQVVFLEAPMELLLQRCHAPAPLSAEQLRPLAANPNAFRSLYAERLPRYRAADFTLNTQDMSFEQQAEAIVARLHLPTGRL